MCDERPDKIRSIVASIVKSVVSPLLGEAKYTSEQVQDLLETGIRAQLQDHFPDRYANTACTVTIDHTQGRPLYYITAFAYGVQYDATVE